MNKTTKGAVAAATAGVLLLGGAGSLAFWSEAETVTGSAINSGSLALTTPQDGVWTLNGLAMDPTTVEVVPGDELEYTGSYTIDAEGENLQATVGVTGGAATGTLADDITRTVAAEIDGDVVTSVTDENDGAALDVVVSVDFPFDESLETPTADNLSQSSTLDLASVAVTLTQTDATE